MTRDDRPVMEQVKSGFLIVAKMLAAFGIAVTFMAGCMLIRTSENWHHIALGWLLISSSVVVMTTTARFWAAGFFGFVAYGALRSFGFLVAGSFHVSTLYVVSVSASLFGMSFLSVRFASSKIHITVIDRAGVVIAASCVLVGLLLADTYKSVAVLNVGNVALLLSWWAGRLSRHNHHRARATPE